MHGCRVRVTCEEGMLGLEQTLIGYGHVNRASEGVQEGIQEAWCLK